MAAALLLALDRRLVGEEELMQELARTEIARDLQNVRINLTKHVQTVAKSGDLNLIVATEKAIVAGDLKPYAKVREWTGALLQL